MKRLIIVVMMAILLGACSSGGGASTPEAAAKNWIEAFFKADGTTMRANMCNLQGVALTDTIVSQLASGLSSTGASLDLSGLSYSYNQATTSVTIGGVVRVTVAGQTVERSLDALQLNILPMVQEDGGWKVCLNLLGR